MTAEPDFAIELSGPGPDQEVARLAPHHGQAGPEPARPRVVIVDEHNLLSDRIQLALEGSGIRVLGTATSANGALASLGHGLADAVIFCMRTESAVDQPPGAYAASPSLPARAATPRVVGPGLTSREQQVLRLLVQGASNKDMARRLSIRSNTVRTHVQNLLAKLQVHTRLEAVTLSIRVGLLEPDESNPVPELATS